jgi:hypothetical protein
MHWMSLKLPDNFQILRAFMAVPVSLYPQFLDMVSEPTFLHQIKRCSGILFGLSAQVNMAFIFEINTNINENHKEMS